jgi:curved DNA-binding protein CbpA
LSRTFGFTPEIASAGGKVRYHYAKPDNPRDLFIKIPPGIREGQKIRLKDKGKDGSHGGKAGNLYPKVRISISFFIDTQNFRKFAETYETLVMLCQGQYINLLQ